MRLRATCCGRPRGLHGAKAAVGADQRIQHQEAEDRAHLHELEHVHLAHRLAAGHRDDQHQGEPAGHPQRGQGFGRGAVHVREQNREDYGAGRYRRAGSDLQRANMPTQRCTGPRVAASKFAVGVAARSVLRDRPALVRHSGAIAIAANPGNLEIPGLVLRTIPE